MLDPRVSRERAIRPTGDTRRWPWGILYTTVAIGAVLFGAALFGAALFGAALFGAADTPQVDAPTSQVAGLPDLEQASLADRRKYVESLKPADQFELQQKKDRFSRLASGEQRRIRDLHRQINDAPDRAQLQVALLKYNEWLRTLSSSRRAQILSQSTDERLTSIRKAFEDQTTRRLVASTPLQSSDYTAIKRWLNNYARKHEKSLVASMHPKVREQWQTAAPQRKMFMLCSSLTRDPDRMAEIPEADLTFLSRLLSPEAKKSLEQAGANRREVLFGWFRVAGFQLRNAGQQPNTRQLRSFFNSLDSRKKEQIEALPPMEARTALTILYQSDRAPFRGVLGAQSGKRPASDIQLAPRPNVVPTLSGGRGLQRKPTAANRDSANGKTTRPGTARATDRAKD